MPSPYIKYILGSTHGTPSESAVAPKLNLIQLGSAHEWSGVHKNPHPQKLLVTLRKQYFKIKNKNMTGTILDYNTINEPEPYYEGINGKLVVLN